MELSLEEALALLPKDIRELVASLPAEEREKVLQQLLVESEIEYRPLEEHDLGTIKERTTGSFEYGFKEVDVDITWAELSRPNYVSLGAFAEQEGRQVPVAFVVAELVTAPPAAEAVAAAATAAAAEVAAPAAEGAAADGAAEVTGSARDALQASTSEPGAGTTSTTTSTSNSPKSSKGAKVGGSSSSKKRGGSSKGSSSRRLAPLRVGEAELAAAMVAAGCSGAGDVAVAVWYLGVSYEYRRQGLGSRLLDLVKEVGEAARAKALWLHVADYNDNAAAFYAAYGMTSHPAVYKQGERGRHLLMSCPLGGTGAQGEGEEGREGGEQGEEEEEVEVGVGAGGGGGGARRKSSRGFSGGGGGGGGGGGKKKGKGGKRRALPSGEEEGEEGGVRGVGHAAGRWGLLCGGQAMAGAAAGTSRPWLAGRLQGGLGGGRQACVVPRAVAWCGRGWRGAGALGRRWVGGGSGLGGAQGGGRLLRVL